MESDSKRLLKRRVEQQSVVADLGLLALSGAPFDQLLQAIVVRVRDMLDVEYCKVLAYRPEHDDLQLIAGVGWKSGLQGVSVQAGRDSQGGYTLRVNHPVFVEDLENEIRFQSSDLLLEHGVKSGISVVIHGADNPFGVLGAHSRSRRRFNEDDGSFLQAIANLIGHTYSLGRTTSALRRSEERMRRAILFAPVPMMLHAKTGEVLELSRSWLTLSGYGREQIQSIHDWTLHAFGERQSEALERIDRLFELSGPDSEGEHIVRHRDGGSLIWAFHSAPLGSDNRGRRLVITIAVDVTERRAIERRLADSEARYRALFQNARDGLLVYHIDDEGRPGPFVEANDIICKRLGYSGDEIRRLSVLDILDSEDEAILAGLRELQERNERLVETVHLTSGGERIPTEVNAYVFELLGQSTVLSICRDIRERKRIEEEMARYRAELERKIAERTEALNQALRELDQFAYIASHDLRTPLRAIDNLASWVNEDAHALLPPQSAEHLEKMREQVQRMERLLKSLYAYSRAGRDHPADSEPIEPARLVHEITDLLSLPEGFRIEVTGDTDSIQTDRVPLELVLRNLIGNAIQHHDREEGEIEISFRMVEDGYEIRVEDDGPGIEPAYRNQMFYLFQTLEPNDRIKSRGIGLSIVKKVIQSRGGYIQVESGPTRGTRFIFLWPA